MLYLMSFIFLIMFLFIYVIYYLLIYNTSKKYVYNNEIKNYINMNIRRDELPRVTIIMPVYNEEKTIYDKIMNLSSLDYPLEKLNLIVVNDSSTDNTEKIVRESMKKFGIDGKIILNKPRQGVNVSYNKAIPNASDYILTTDADSIIPSNTLINGIKILLNMEEVGALSVKMIPTASYDTTTTKVTESYTDLYNSMLLAESAIYSTFPGSTSCMMMKKSAFSPISTSYGSSDGNLSLSIIRNGYKYILVPSLHYYEPISTNFYEQMRQKIRRSTRLMQSIFLNIDMCFSRKYGEFSKYIFPLRILIMVLCPFLLLTFIISFYLSIYLYNYNFFILSLFLPIIFILISIGSNISITKKILSFLIYQFYLLAGVILSFKKMTKWKKIERVI